MSQSNGDDERLREQGHGTTEHAHGRLDMHEERLGTLEKWQERVMGAITMLAFLVGTSGALAFGIDYFLF
jgi:hypothetical protein